MTFNKLKTKLETLIPVLGICLMVISCNDDQSANNSTPGNDESVTDTAATTRIAPPAAAPKKTGKVSMTRGADNREEKMVKDKQGIYNRTEVEPAFSGGESALENYIISAIEYPQNAIDNNIEGKVNVRFAVDEKGNISNVSTFGEKIGYGLEEEAIKVVSDMPKWTPGQVKGKNVKTWRTLPINYRLEG
jgi:periplasmic protein TonB